MSNASLRFGGVLLVAVFLAAALFAPAAKAQGYWCPNVPTDQEGDLSITINRTFDISDVKVYVTGTMSLSGGVLGSGLRLRRVEDNFWVILAEFYLHTSGFDIIFENAIFTDEDTKQGPEAKSEYFFRGEVLVSALANFVGHNGEGTWMLELVYDAYEPVDISIDITSFGLVFNDAKNCSLSVPWYVDNAPANSGLPPSMKNTSIVYLHNNLETEMGAHITYYTASGVNIGPEENLFTIAPSSTIAFRPVADDPVGPETPLGQEDPATGALVPNRPMTGEGNDGKKNGSLVVRWAGNPTDVQGMVKTWSTSATDSFTLPPGATQD